MFQAILAFFMHGLRPGSCTTYLLKGEYERAYACAHPSIKDRWDNRIHWIEKHVPMCIRGDNFDNWSGWKKEYRGTEVETLTILSTQDPTLFKHWMNKSEIV